MVTIARPTSITAEQKLEALAYKVKTLLEKYELFEDVRIYFNDQCIDSNKGLIRHINPVDYFEYANANTLSLAFEGPLYLVLNDCTAFPTFEPKLVALFKEYGYYHQLGDAWNLTLYEL